MRKNMAILILSVCSLFFNLELRGQQLSMAPQGVTISSVPGQNIAKLTIINTATEPSTNFDSRGVTFSIDRSKNELGIYPSGLGQSIKFYAQASDFNIYTPSLQINGDGGVVLPGGVKFGGAVSAGSIRWNGTDFQGYDGSQWKSLTTQSIQDTGFWQASPSAGQLPSCPVNYSQAATTNGKVCNNGYGDQIYRNSGTGAYNCGSTIGPLVSSVWCVKVR